MTRRAATTAASGTSYSGRATSAPTTAAAPTTSSQAVRRSGDHRPTTAQPAAARTTSVGAASQGETEVEAGVTWTSERLGERVADARSVARERAAGQVDEDRDRQDRRPGERQDGNRTQARSGARVATAVHARTQDSRHTVASVSGVVEGGEDDDVGAEQRGDGVPD